MTQEPRAAVERRQVFVERGVSMAYDLGVAAWSFDLDLWGLVGQGRDEEGALDDLRRAVGTSNEVEFDVAERVDGDEKVFQPDLRACTSAERDATSTILAECRQRTIELIGSCPPEVLDWDDPERRLPSYARWRTIRQLAWHVVDTESRYYLPMAGLGYREPCAELTDELVRSAAQVRNAVQTMPADLVRRHDGQVWTSVKLLRRLAWHERGELAVMESLAARRLRPGG
jgi:hypothetical protein